MNQIAAIQASKFACFDHLTPEVRNEQIKSLFYIERMAGVTNTDISKIDIFDVFGRKDAEKALLVTSKGEVNKRLAALTSIPQDAIDPTIDSAHDAAIEAMNQAYMARATDRLNRLKNDHRSSIQEADRHSARVNEYMKNAWDLMVEMQRIEGGTFDFKKMFSEIVSDGFFAIHAIDRHEVSFTTRNDIVLSHRNKLSGVDLQVNMGRYKAVYAPRNGTVRVLAHERNPIASNHYYHPYVNGSGSICFGNADGQARKLLASANLREYFQLLTALLSTYAVDSNPYISLENFQEAAKRGLYEIRPTCRNCGAIEGACNCQYCPKCESMYSNRRCREHWCEHCESYNKYDCGCCPECGSTDGEHDTGCSDYCEPEQTATIVEDDEISF